MCQRLKLVSYNTVYGGGGPSKSERGIGDSLLSFRVELYYRTAEKFRGRARFPSRVSSRKNPRGETEFAASAAGRRKIGKSTTRRLFLSSTHARTTMGSRRGKSNRFSGSIGRLVVIQKVVGSVKLGCNCSAGLWTNLPSSQKCVSPRK